MSPLLHLIVVSAVAYAAAGAFYVLRGLGDVGEPARGIDARGLIAVAVCWLPITVSNLVADQRTGSWSALLTRFGIETMPPLVLFIAILATSSALLSL